MKLRWAVAAVCMFAWASAAPAQFGVNFNFTYKCAPGRFRVSYGKKSSIWHYCYDEKYYNEKTLPADIRAYFEKVDRDHKEAMEKFHKDWEESKQRSAAHWAKIDADRVARGLPTLAEQREENKRRLAERHGRTVFAGTAGGAAAGRQAGGSMLLRPSGMRGGGVEASGKPEAEPVTPEALKSIAAGTPAADLVAALGEPPGKVATGEGAESWTYVLTSGAFAKVKMEGGAVKEVVLPN